MSRLSDHDEVVMGESESRWGDIFTHLKNKGYDVFSPGVKVGDCMEPYIVVVNNGSTSHVLASSDVSLYSVICYVPKQRYGDLEPMVQAVKKCMVELQPMILPYGLETPSFYDDSYKAHMVSIEYKNYKQRHYMV